MVPGMADRERDEFVIPKPMVERIRAVLDPGETLQAFTVRALQDELRRREAGLPRDRIQSWVM